MNNIYFDLYTETPDVSETDISDLIITRIKEYQSQQGLIRKSNFIKDFDSMGFYSKDRSMWTVFSEQDANFGVFSNDASTLFLGTAKEFMSILTFLEQQDWTKINIAEWVMISEPPSPQSSLYLRHFRKYGLQPYGQLQWNSFNGRIAFVEVRNSDSSRFINGKKQES